jgi:alpha-galactosidase
LSVDHAVSGLPLSIAGVSYPRGLGTQAGSFIRLRAERAGGSFTGACGIDDGDHADGRAEFRIRNDAGEVLYESGEVRRGQAGQQFSVELTGRRELLLEVRVVGSPPPAQADWVDLRVQGSP